MNCWQVSRRCLRSKGGRRRVTRRALIGAAGALAFGAHVKAQDGPRQRGGIVDAGLAQLPVDWDPLTSREFSTTWLSTLLYDSLFQIGPGGESLPGLGLFTERSKDGRRLRITLRPHARFADGREITARDVVTSLERSRGVSWRLETVSHIEAVAETTVDIITSRPDASLPYSLASSKLPILPSDAPAFGDAVARGRLPVGSGPFRPLPLDGDEVRMLANSWYWQIGRPCLGGVRVRPVAGESTRTASLLTREVDLLPDVPLLDVQLCRQDPSLSVVGGATVGACMLVLNLRTSPMEDSAFRQVINAAIDREALVKAATDNEATPQQVFVPQDHWAAFDAPLQKPDSGKLKQQLRDLGYPVGLRLRMVSDERNVSLSNAAVFLQEQLAFVGIALAVDLLDAATLRNVLADGDFDMYATNVDPWRDPHELFRPWLMSDGERNAGGYSSLPVDRLIRKGVEELDPVRRAPVYQELQRLVLEDVPVVVLYLQNAFDSLVTRLHDYPLYPPVSALALRHAWLSEE